MPPAQPTPLTRPDGTALRVLTVDDEPSLTELLAMAMRYEGWEVTTAATGTDAVHAARAVKPDAIVLDVPVIFLTAKDGVADRITGLTAGGDDYVTKPFSL